MAELISNVLNISLSVKTLPVISASIDYPFNTKRQSALNTCQGWKHSSVPNALFSWWLDGFIVAETSCMCPYEVACWSFLVWFLPLFVDSVHKETQWIQEFAFQHWSTKVTVCTWGESQHQRYGQDKVNDLIREKLSFRSVLCPLDPGWAMLLT